MTLARLHRRWLCPARELRVAAPTAAGRPARLRARRHAADVPRRGQPPAGVGDARWTAPSRPAPPRHEKRNIALEIPVWDDDLCTQCGKCVFVCPHSAIRARAFPAGRGGRARRPPSSTCPPRARISRPAPASVTRWRPRTAPAAATASRPARSTTSRNISRAGRRTWRRMAPLREPEREQLRFLPQAARLRPQPAQARHHPRRDAAGAAVRVLRRLRRLRRDALHPPRHPALRRPHAGGQRHRLFVDLRRQPADHALHAMAPGRGPAWSQFAVRGQRRVRPGHAPGRRQAEPTRHAPICKALAGQLGADLADALVAADQRSEAGIRAQRERVAELLQPLLSHWPHRAAKQLAAARRMADPALGMDHRRRRLGLRHRLRRPRPRAGPGLRREHPGPRHRGVFEHRRPDLQGHRRCGAVAKFAAGGKTTAKKDLARIASDYGHVYRGHGGLRRQGRAHPRRPSTRPRATPARR